VFKRLAVMMVLASVASGCVPASYFKYKGDYYRLSNVPETNRTAIYRLYPNGEWVNVELDSTVYKQDVADKGQQIDASEADKEAARRRCGGGNCEPEQPAPGVGEGGSL